MPSPGTESGLYRRRRFVAPAGAGSPAAPPGAAWCARFSGGRPSTGAAAGCCCPCATRPRRPRPVKRPSRSWPRCCGRAAWATSPATRRPTDTAGVLPELDERRRAELALRWAKDKGFLYGVTGSVEEWRYRNGLDGEPAVGRERAGGRPALAAGGLVGLGGAGRLGAGHAGRDRPGAAQGAAQGAGPQVTAGHGRREPEHGSHVHRPYGWRRSRPGRSPSARWWWATGCARRIPSSPTLELLLVGPRSPADGAALRLRPRLRLRPGHHRAAGGGLAPADRPHPRVPLAVRGGPAGHGHAGGRVRRRLDPAGAAAVGHVQLPAACGSTSSPAPTTCSRCRTTPSSRRSPAAPRTCARPCRPCAGSCWPPSSPTGPLLGIESAILTLFSHYGWVQTAALFSVDDKGKVEKKPVATIGKAEKISPADPLVRQSLERCALCSVRPEMSPAERGTELLAAIPFADTRGRMWAVLAVRGDAVRGLPRRQPQAAGGAGRTRRRHPGLRRRLVQRRRRHPGLLPGQPRRAPSRTGSSFDLPAVLVSMAFARSEQGEALAQQILGARRGLDQALLLRSRTGETRVFMLMPFTDERGAEGYLGRLRRMVQERYGTDLETAGLADPHPRDRGQGPGRGAVRRALPGRRRGRRGGGGVSHIPDRKQRTSSRPSEAEPAGPGRSPPDGGAKARSSVDRIGQRLGAVALGSPVPLYLLGLFCEMTWPTVDAAARPGGRAPAERLPGAALSGHAIISTGPVSLDAPAAAPPALDGLPLAVRGRVLPAAARGAGPGRRPGAAHAASPQGPAARPRSSPPRSPISPTARSSCSSQPIYGVVGLVGVIRHAAETAARVRAVMATRQLSDQYAVPILQVALRDPVDDVRLLAYALLDGKERDHLRQHQAAQRPPGRRAQAHARRASTSGWPTNTGSWSTWAWPRARCWPTCWTAGSNTPCWPSRSCPPTPASASCSAA